MKIGVIGLGTVGLGVVEILTKTKRKIRKTMPTRSRYQIWLCT